MIVIEVGVVIRNEGLADGKLFAESARAKAEEYRAELERLTPKTSLFRVVLTEREVIE